MHLLGTSVVGFILLPLAFSCEISQKTREEKNKISQDYENIIVKQLQHINVIVDEELKQLKKPCRRNFTCHNIDNPETFIYNASCNRMPKGLKTNLENELKTLVKNIHRSLGCQCSNQQGDQPARDGQPRVRKRLCRLKCYLGGIQRAYEKYNST